MPRATKTDRKLHSLREDAAKVAGDIHNLTKQLSNLGSEKTTEIKDQLLKNYEEQLTLLRERMDEINSEMHQYAHQADQHIRANPYSYIFGALSLGLLLGKWCSPRRRD